MRSKGMITVITVLLILGVLGYIGVSYVGNEGNGSSSSVSESNEKLFISPQVATQGGMGVETVRYTQSGFQPATRTVSVGTMVEFVNQSDKPMWVASNVHPEHVMLPTFDQFKQVSNGQRYMYTFDKKGSWPYHDHVNPSRGGIINVE